MVILKFLRQYHWTIREYHLSTNRAEGAERFLMAWGSAVVIVRYLVNCFEALGRMNRGLPGTGLAMTEFNLLHLLLMWIVFPLLITRGAGSGMGLNFKQLLQYPFTRKELFLATVSRVTVMPVFWILLFFSPFCLLPLAFSPAPAAAIGAGLLYILFALFLYWLIEITGNLVNLKSSIYINLLRLFILALFLANFSFSWPDGKTMVSVFNIKILLTDFTTGTGLLAGLKSWFPASWVTLAAGGQWLFLLFFIPLAAVLLFLSWLIFCLLLKSGFEICFYPARKKSSLYSRWPFIASAASALVSRELLDRIKSVEFILPLLLSCLLGYYSFTARENIINITFFLVPLIYLFTIKIISNSFAGDGRGFTRFRLLPLAAGRLLSAKNRAYFIIMTMLMLPGLVCLGFTDMFLSVNLSLMCITAAVLDAVWGNFTSVLTPAPAARKSFGGTRQPGGVFTTLFGLGLWIGLLFLYQKLSSPRLNTGVNLVITTAAIIAYAYYLPRTRTLLESRMEEMAERLS